MSDTTRYVLKHATRIYSIYNGSILYIFSYCMYNEGHMEWFATSISLLVIFSLFTQTFSHIFFTYNNVADKACSLYLQHIISKSGKIPFSMLPPNFLHFSRNLTALLFKIYLSQSLEFDALFIT